MKKPGYVRYSKQKLQKLSSSKKPLTLYMSNGHPRFKSKHNHDLSYRTNDSNGNKGYPSIEVKNKKVKLPKLGWVKTKNRQEIDGKIIHAVVNQTPSGKYYVLICVDCCNITPLPKTNKSVGLDLGLHYFCVSSDGIHFDNPQYLKKSLTKLKQLHRELDRKSKYSSNWEKARVKLARQYEKVSNQRMDYLNKLSTQIIKENDNICVETLVVSNMIRNYHLAQSISDVSWNAFVEKLKYKSKWYGRNLYQVDRFYPSSQICHICGHRNSSIKDLRIRTWECPECGGVHDRDINAAINILYKGLLQTG